MSPASPTAAYTPPGVWSASDLTKAINKAMGTKYNSDYGRIIIGHLRKGFDGGAEEVTFKEAKIPAQVSGKSTIVPYQYKALEAWGIQEEAGQMVVAAHQHRKEGIATTRATRLHEHEEKARIKRMDQARRQHDRAINKRYKGLLRPHVIVELFRDKDVRTSRGTLFSSDGIKKIIEDISEQFAADPEALEIEYEGVKIPRNAIRECRTRQHPLGIEASVARELAGAIKKKNGRFVDEKGMHLRRNQPEEEAAGPGL